MRICVTSRTWFSWPGGTTGTTRTGGEQLFGGPSFGSGFDFGSLASQIEKLGGRGQRDRGASRRASGGGAKAGQNAVPQQAGGTGGPRLQKWDLSRLNRDVWSLYFNIRCSLPNIKIKGAVSMRPR